MINFRFHLVSLIAVFLALALGVVVGSTVIDRAIVDGLEAQIERVERNAETQRRENSLLRERIDRLETFTDQVAPYAVAGRLTEVPVTVLAVRGVDTGAAYAAVEALREAGAVAPGVVWLEPRWGLVEQDETAALREVLDRSFGTADVLRARALMLLAERLTPPAPEAPPGEAAPGETGGPDGPAAPETEAPTAPAVPEAPEAPEGREAGDDGVDLLVALADAGFVELDSAGGEDLDPGAFPAPGSRTVVIDGPDAQVSAETLFVPLVEALARFEAPALAAEVTGSGADSRPGAVVAFVRDGELADQVATVDGLDDVSGRVAVVLGLETLGEGRIVHLGTGAGAPRQLPEPVPG